MSPVNRTLIYNKLLRIEPERGLWCQASESVWEEVRQNLKLCEDVMSGGRPPSACPPPVPHTLRAYEALAFLALGEVLSSDLTTPLVAPPAGSKQSHFPERSTQTARGSG